MHKVTGTAHKAFKGANYDPAGKTGTARVGIAQGERYDTKSLKERQRDNAIYVGFAPYNGLVVSVVVENTGGSTVGAPIARQLMDYYFSANPIQIAK